MPRPTAALELLTGDAQTFRTEVWASRVALHKADPTQLVGYLSLADVDRLLTATAIRTPAVRVAQDGAVLPASRYTRTATIAGQSMTGLVDARKLLDLFEGGASVVLQGLQRYWDPLTELCSRLEDELGHPCQANAYLTPPGSQGFAVHSDSHDVFVFQTHGTKQWEVHEHGERRDVLLEPGLVMYLPTGTPHAARAQDGASLHVTLGINQLTWGTVLDDVVHRLPGRDEHLPAGYLDDPGLLADGLRDRLTAWAARLGEVDVDAATQRQVRSFLSNRPPRLAGGLLDRLAMADVGDTTRLQRRPGHPMRFRSAGEKLEVLLGDRVLTVPAYLRPHLEQVVGLESLTPADLAGLDPQSRVVLCRRLVREGLLEVAGE